VIASSFSGVVHSIAAATGQIRWATPFPRYQAHSSPALGRFKGGVLAGSLDDPVAAKRAGGDVAATAGADVVVALHRGSFPHYTNGLVVWLDGATGRVLREYVVHWLERNAPAHSFTLLPFDCVGPCMHVPVVLAVGVVCTVVLAFGW
jgi:hypothetical protein